MTDVKWFRVGDLQVDPAYQGNYSPAWLKYLEKKFDSELVGVLDVAVRDDGRPYLVDGKHRHFEMVRRGMLDHQVPCHVVYDLGQAGEAGRYDGLNKHRPRDPFASFNARLLNGGEAEQEIVNILSEHGLVLGYIGQYGANVVKAVNVVEDLYLRNQFPEDSQTLLSRTAEVVLGAWDLQKGATDGRVFSGVGLAIAGVFKRHPDHRKFYNDLEYLSSKIEDEIPTPEDLIVRGRFSAKHRVYGPEQAHNRAGLVVEAYNKNKRVGFRLPAYSPSWHKG